MRPMGLLLISGIREHAVKAASVHLDVIRHEKDGWHVYSEDGAKHLGGPYPTKEEAEERLRQIEGHKDAVKKAVRRHSLSFALNTQESLVERPAPGKAPTAFRIWAAGENVADDGPIYFTPESATALLQEQSNRARLYSIDFDHLSVTSDRPAEAGRAAGWFNLEVRPDPLTQAPTLWAVNIEWCADVKAGLEQDPPLWRYFSPAFLTDENGVVNSFINLAICINPMTHGLPALASTKVSKGNTMAKHAETLQALMDEEKDPEKKEALKAALAALSPEESETKDEPKKEAKKAAEGEPAGDEDGKEKEHEDEEPPPDSEKGEKPAAEEKKESKHSIKAASSLARENVELRARLDRLEIGQELEKRKDLSESVRTWCLTQTPDVVRSFLKTVPRTNAVRNEKPAQGGSGPALLEGAEREEIERGMGLMANKPIAPHKDESGRFFLHTMKPSDVRTFVSKKGAA